MTTVWSRKDGWIAIAPVIDNGCRTVFEIGVSKEQDAPAILQPFEDSLRTEFGEPSAVPDDFALRSDTARPHEALHLPAPAEYRAMQLAQPALKRAA